jgi:hypothetical protein
LSLKSQSSGRFDALKQPAATALLEREPKSSVRRPHVEDSPWAPFDRIRGQLISYLGDLYHRNALMRGPDRARPTVEQAAADVNLGWSYSNDCHVSPPAA